MNKFINIIDFGSQYTQLIARRIRELGTYCEVVPWNIQSINWDENNCMGFIFSGSSASILDIFPPKLSIPIIDSGRPILGICYGMHYIVAEKGGRIVKQTSRHYGNATIRASETHVLFDEIAFPANVWMSHGDSVEQLPENFIPLAQTDSETIAAFMSTKQPLYGVMFHPEVTHTFIGKQILSNFSQKICQCSTDWTASNIIEESINQIKNETGDNDRAICAVSGGVDSMVTSVLAHKAIGSHLNCVFVDHGLLRKDDKDFTLANLKLLNLPVKIINAQTRFMDALRDVIDPEKKRRLIGELFIRIFEEEAHQLGNIRFLIQGTLYSDVIESVSPVLGQIKIKSHHNVGGLPDKMRFKLIEPLRKLFKDEVRAIGKVLDLPKAIYEQHPFPGPGLAIRCLGEVTGEKLRILRDADYILMQVLKETGFYQSASIAFAVLLPIEDATTLQKDAINSNVIAIRLVNTEDFMTADWTRLPYYVLEMISSRIMNNVQGIRRVVYDITTKPPATIDWE